MAILLVEREVMMGAASMSEEERSIRLQLALRDDAGIVPGSPASPSDDDDSTRIKPSVGGPVVPHTGSTAGDDAPLAQPITSLPPATRDARTDSSLPPSARAVAEPLTDGGRPGAPLARRAGRYLIGERLGRGGMATVFKAHDPDIGASKSRARWPMRMRAGSCTATSSPAT
jgi:hypothetical protein